MALLTPEQVLVSAPDEDPAYVEMLVEETLARARILVPKLADESSLSDDQKLAVRGILRNALLRYLESGDGSITTESAPGGFSQTIQTAGRRGVLGDKDLEDLMDVVGVSTRPDQKRGFDLGQDYRDFSAHEDGCAIFWSQPCDCDLTYPTPGLHRWW